VPVRLDNVFGKVQSYAAASAACIGLIFGLNLVKISEALKSYQPASGRMKLLPGVKSSLILDDSYNASPLSMHAALETLKGLPAKRRIAVLGDMLEIGRYSMEAHERMGRIAAKAASILVTIGPRAKFIAEGAKEAGLNRRNIFSFETAEDACETVGQLLKKGDLVLLKGSHSMNLEKVVAEVRQIENQ
jgi:UDP-N-acetylmuramoyl-tripeptide--D-alanyl-D-alanine ligase